MEAIVLAGGLGTRLRGVVDHVPKPMAIVHERPFLEYLLIYWQKQGVRRFILSVGYQHQIIQSHFGNRCGHSRIEYSVEKKPLGTGGALLQAAHLLKTKHNFLVLNGDTFFEVSLRNFEKFHLQHKSDVSLALAECGGEDRYERIQLGPDGRIASLKQRGSGAPSGLINGGVYFLNARCLKGFLARPDKKISFESELLPFLLKARKNIFGFKANARFIDIGTPASYKAAGKFLKRIKSI